MVHKHPKMVSRIKIGTTVEDNPLYVLKVKVIQELLILTIVQKYESKSYFVTQLASFYLFVVYFWLCWVFIAAPAFSPAGVSRGTFVGFSLQGSQALEHRLNRCGTGASLLLGTWDLPRPGIKPMSPALAGRFLFTMPPGMALANF